MILRFGNPPKLVRICVSVRRLSFLVAVKEANQGGIHTVSSETGFLGGRGERSSKIGDKDLNGSSE